MKGVIGLGVILIAAIIVLVQSVYIVDVTEQVVILRFGEVVGLRPNPGLYVKAPFVDTVIRYDKRVLRIDAQPVPMPDIEKENLVIDSYARYRIVDPVQFRKTLQTEDNARSRLGDIVTSGLRSEVARRDRIEIIGAEPLLDPPTGIQIVEKGIPQIQGTEARTEILENVLEVVKRSIAEEDTPFGIQMIDVRIKRADFPDEVTPSIYTRMRAERNRIAAGFRADGDEKELIIRADADREAAVIRAEAQRDSSQVRGEGEAEAISILAEALNQDPEFFAFQRSLQTYRKGLPTGTTVILTDEAPFLNYLLGPDAPQSNGLP
jgi:membrane protease subunit HflC